MQEKTVGKWEPFPTVRHIAQVFKVQYYKATRKHQALLCGFHRLQKKQKLFCACWVNMRQPTTACWLSDATKKRQELSTQSPTHMPLNFGVKSQNKGHISADINPRMVYWWFILGLYGSRQKSSICGLLHRIYLFVTPVVDFSSSGEPCEPNISFLFSRLFGLLFLSVMLSE